MTTTAIPFGVKNAYPSSNKIFRTISATCFVKRYCDEGKEYF